MSKAFYKVFPPYIDAYRVSQEGTLQQFKEDLKANAIEWGTQSIGEQVRVRLSPHS